MTRTFLSHSSQDKAFVRLVAADIQACQAAVWIDELELGVGDSFMTRIGEAVATADFVALFISLASLDSRWVAEEIELAQESEARRGTVVLLPVLVPGLVDSAIPRIVAQRLFADLRAPSRYNRSFDSILRRISPEALPTAEMRHYGLTLTASRAERLVDAGREPSLREWVIEYFCAYVGAGARSPDATERQWAYVGLGRLGGQRARESIEAGLSEVDPLARQGAEQAITWLRGTRTVTGTEERTS